jgi:histidinol-phosphate/aromatic aminotransferase/cobyric acid decarboxylase-like protein/choline kinase
MKALILAAGYGQRMRPLTDHRHKTLLSVGGRTIIDRILHGLRLHGVTDVTIVTGYRADELVGHLRENHPDVDFTFVHNERYDKTNNIFSMALAFEQMTFDADLLLIESDLIYEPAVLDRILKSSHENVALVDRYQPGMDGTVVALTEDGVVSQVIPPSQQSASFDFSDKYKTLNIYRFARDFCATTLHRLLTTYARLIDDNCYYELVLGMLVYMQQAEIRAEVVDSELWSEVDDPTDLRLAEFRFDPSARYGILESAWGGAWDLGVLDFAFIRNMHFPTPAMLSELRFHLPELLQNYGSAQAVLDTKLSWALQWPAGAGHLLSGASQCYPWLRSWFADATVLLPDPTFGEYTRIFPRAERYTDGPGVDWDDLEAKAAAADVVVIVNPNNPTGTTLDSHRIAELARAHPDTTVVVDESFVEFSGQQPMTEIVPREQITNVLVVKSLSKSLGVPGLRLGALMTLDPDLGARIAAETPIWNSNSVAENFLDLMLKHRPALAQSFRRTVADRDDLVTMLGRLPIVEQVHPSGANFVLARLDLPAAAAGEMCARLVEKRLIHVKDVSAKFGDGAGWWRVAVRTPADHDRLRDAVLALAPRRYDRARPAPAAVPAPTRTA